MRGGYLSQQQRARRPLERQPLRETGHHSPGHDTPFFNLEAAAQLLTDNPHFHVIGIMGTEGTGKPQLANALLGLSNSCMTHPQVTVPLQQGPGTRPASHAQGGADKPSDSPSCFPTCGSGQQEAPCSSGIDMRVSSLDRTIVIDTRPLLSPDALLALMDPKAPAPEPGTLLAELAAKAWHQGSPEVQPELVQHLQDLQLAIFLLASCQMVVIMVESEDSPAVWSLLQVADMHLQGTPDASQAGATQSVQLGLTGEGGGALTTQQMVRSAEVVFVLANQLASDMQPLVLRPKHAILSCMFAGSSLAAKQGRVSIVHELEQQQQRHPHQQAQQPGDGVTTSPGTIQAGSFVHLWALPDPCEAQDLQGLVSRQRSSNRSVASVAFLVEPWRQLASRLLSHPRQPWARPMSEREWLKGTLRLWGALQSSQELKEYIQGLQHVRA